MAEEFVLQESDGDDGGDRPAWVPIPDGTKLLMQIEDVKTETKPFKDKDGNDIVKVVFSFVVVEEGPFYDRKIQGETPTTFTTHPDCKLRNWVQEILKQDLPAGFRLNTDILVGELVDAVVSAKESERKDGKGIWVRNWVSDIQRYVEDPALVSAALAEEPF